MKNIRLLLLLVTALTFTACPDDDILALFNDLPSVNFDVATVIALPSGADITNLVTFGGVNAADYRSDLSLNETVTVSRPDGLLPTDGFLYVTAVIFDDQDVEVEFDEVTNISSDGNLELVVPDGEPADYYDNPDGVPSFILRAIDADQAVDIDYKYLVEVTIERNDIIFGPYTIDPKIRIKSVN
ncbi:MAG: hypothetical protein ED556_08020 [Winogradskyella sp.]|uniref:hypothetical protein n=1 Tax=Winogradskyella sp. TaxID=1883156 RepID=UPI000F410C41|nr:hypothetical protein [Winogradskyella sp.]RNC86235.1 MAG: hypothetical protein ED556_08020 [Winogradskyella sp.]